MTRTPGGEEQRGSHGLRGAVSTRRGMSLHWGQEGFPEEGDWEGRDGTGGQTDHDRGHLRIAWGPLLTISV